MMKWEEKIEEEKKNFNPCNVEIILCAKKYIEAQHAIRSNQCCWQSCPPRDTPIWKEYAILKDARTKAYADLLIACDVEYSDDEMTQVAWNWKYWNVMARKCCHYQRSILTDHRASKTMRRLHNAEAKLMEVCGLEELYKSPCHYIEEAFPNLKKK